MDGWMGGWMDFCHKFGWQAAGTREGTFVRLGGAIHYGGPHGHPVQFDLLFSSLFLYRGLVYYYSSLAWH